MKYFKLAALVVSGFCIATMNKQDDHVRYWMKIKAHNKFERSVIADAGLAIEGVGTDSVFVVGSFEQMQTWKQKGLVQMSFPLENMLQDFPTSDSPFHNYAEVTKALQDLHSRYPTITTLTSIGKSVEGRDIWSLRLCGQMEKADQLPGSIFMGGHHAREHLSVDTPLRILENILKRYESQDAKIVALIDNRDVHFIPAVNPDGLEWDISTGSYQYWRKNRARNSSGNYGVDLNRNYGYQWNHGGSSSDSNDDTFMGPAPFSEPETRAIRDYVDGHKNLNILLSFHTFSELILYPWGHKYDPIENSEDLQVHEIMARKMAQWNGYTPKQASELYIASGDTTDWSYGTHKIVSFTFELDPASQWNSGGFYPGAQVIDGVVAKNTEPVIYIIENSNNPKQVLKSPDNPFRP